jgi:hypothetical protein
MPFEFASFARLALTPQFAGLYGGRPVTTGPAAIAIFYHELVRFGMDSLPTLPNSTDPGTDFHRRFLEPGRRSRFCLE